MHMLPLVCRNGASMRQGSRMLTIGMAENNVYGLVLVEMQHDDLKEMGMASVGHRVTLLKGVYDIKVKQNVPLGEDDYVPLCEYDLLLR